MWNALRFCESFLRIVYDCTNHFPLVLEPVTVLFGSKWKKNGRQKWSFGFARKSKSDSYTECILDQNYFPRPSDRFTTFGIMGTRLWGPLNTLVSQYPDVLVVLGGQFLSPMMTRGGNLSVAFNSSRIPRSSLNPFLPTVAFLQLSSNICCPKD